uniref:VAN3-binding protein-like auxin canalisation domain-containing protein n=1 Tax=Oryza meridionalis TaxID=40149 RepID=A0A0E0FC32_9ORYZ
MRKAAAAAPTSAWPLLLLLLILLLDAAAAMAAPAGGTVASTSSVAAAVWSRTTVEETVVELEPLLPADQLDMLQSRRVWSTTKHDTAATTLLPAASAAKLVAGKDSAMATAAALVSTVAPWVVEDTGSVGSNHKN